MTTRVVHRVRCRKKGDKNIWVDVKVVDAVTVITPNGTEILLWVKADGANPFIVDKTGALPTNGKGDRLDCTRVSHMELVTGSDDPKQRFYIEVLDALAFNPPTFNEPDQAGDGLDDNQNRAGLPKAATFGLGPYAIFLPESLATKFIVDDVGLGLASGSRNDASRSGHISLVTEKGNTDDKTDQAGKVIPPDKFAWCAVVKPDAMNFKVPGSDICLILPRGLQDEVDTTQMTTDPLTGEPCPPDNTDPNVYVTFPQDNTNDPNAPTIGCNVKIPNRGGGAKPIDQGPLWWIERVSGTFRPWFWYAKIQSPKAFSFFGSPGRLGSWAYRGFLLWNNYPVIWILSQNNPIVSMGNFGSPSLDLCARIGHWDFAYPPVPNGPIYVPPRPVGVIAPFSALGLTGGTVVEGGGGPYGPFGLLQMTHPPLGPLPDKVPYGSTAFGNNGNEIWSGIPNIWQLTGRQQPNRLLPAKPWDPFTNPYIPPNSKDAETCAKTFRDRWNTSTAGHNAFLENIASTGIQTGYTTPPGWSFPIAWYDPFNAATPGPKYASAFRASIPVGIGGGGLPLEVFIPATGYTIEVDQLDPSVWNTGHLELYNNPINWFLGFVIPPLLWPTTPTP